MTWFTKGLRLFVFLICFILWANKEVIDLIYEGITTVNQVNALDKNLLRSNWPDLRRDYDQFSYCVMAAQPWRSNWPDLRRDYDKLCQGFIYMQKSIEVIDLIYEGITTRPISPNLLRTLYREVIDLIYEGITTFTDIIFHKNSFFVEVIDLIYEGITTKLRWRPVPVLHRWSNWPDLRRDYDDYGKTPVSSEGGSEVIDLIYEGITTSTHQGLILMFFRWSNWPDLRRDYDFARQDAGNARISDSK